MEGYGLSQMGHLGNAGNAQQAMNDQSRVLAGLQEQGFGFRATPAPDMSWAPVFGRWANVSAGSFPSIPLGSTGFPPSFHPNSWDTSSCYPSINQHAPSQHNQPRFDLPGAPFCDLVQKHDGIPVTQSVSGIGFPQTSNQAPFPDRITSPFQPQSLGFSNVGEFGTGGFGTGQSSAGAASMAQTNSQFLSNFDDNLGLFGKPYPSIHKDPGEGFPCNSPFGDFESENFFNNAIIDSYPDSNHDTHHAGPNEGHIDHQNQPGHAQTSPEAPTSANNDLYPQGDPGSQYSGGGQLGELDFGLPIPNCGQNVAAEQLLVDGHSENLIQHPSDGQPGINDIERSSPNDSKRETGDQGKSNSEDHDEINRTEEIEDGDDAFDDTAEDEDAFDETVDSEDIRRLAQAAKLSFDIFAANKELGYATAIKDSYKSWRTNDHEMTKKYLLWKLSEKNNNPERPTKYNGLEEAREALGRKDLDLDPANDPTIPRTDRAKQAAVAELVRAMKSCSRAQGKKEAVETWRSKSAEHADLIELRCWEILEDSINVHVLGQVTGFPSLDVEHKNMSRDSSRRTIKSLHKTFADRLVSIHQTLRLRKGLCKNLLDPTRLQKFVHAPDAEDKSSASNQTTNKKRGKKLKEFDEIKERERRSSANSPHQHFEGVPTSSSPNEPEDMPEDKPADKPKDKSDKGTTSARKHHSSRGSSKAQNKHTSDRASPQTPGNSELGHGHSPAENSNEPPSAKLSRHPAQAQVNTPQNSQSPSGRSSSYSSTNLDADADHAQTSTSRPRNRIGPNRKKPASSQPSQTIEVQYRFAENITLDGQQRQIQQGRIDQSRKRALEETSQHPATTKKRRV